MVSDTPCNKCVTPAGINSKPSHWEADTSYLQHFSRPDETQTVENYHKELRESGQEHLILRPESDHYHTGNIDVWAFADENFSIDEVLGFHRIDAIKYLARYGKKKGYNRVDLEKARAEIDKLLELHDKHRV